MGVNSLTRQGQTPPQRFCEVTDFVRFYVYRALQMVEHVSRAVATSRVGGVIGGPVGVEIVLVKHVNGRPIDD